MTREEILQEAADAVAIEWIADERRLYPFMPVSMDRWISATNVLARSMCTISIKKNDIWSFTSWRLLLMQGCRKWRNREQKFERRHGQRASDSVTYSYHLRPSACAA